MPAAIYCDAEKIRGQCNLHRLVITKNPTYILTWKSQPNEKQEIRRSKYRRVFRVAVIFGRYRTVRTYKYIINIQCFYVAN